MEDASARVEEMCRKLLANGVIEDYVFEIEPGQSQGVDAGWPGVDS